MFIGKASSARLLEPLQNTARSEKLRKKREALFRKLVIKAALEFAPLS
jgi:hypothetical protein